MIQIRKQARVGAPLEDVFERLANLHGYFEGHLLPLGRMCEPIVARIIRAERKRILTALEASFGSPSHL
jgi:hypothetical protein